jgi:O-antigen ligase
MPPQAAALVCVLCIVYLLWIDRRRVEGVSGAVWIPLIWMLLAGSRYVSQWLDLGQPGPMTVDDYSEGSPLDRIVFLMLTLAACGVLLRRRLDWLSVLARNKWIFLFFLFALASSLWSDEPFVAFKRWVKGFGNLAMALVILTERRPYEALGFVMRRLAFVLMPLSVLFIRFYPELGRQYHQGIPMLTGVAFSKNSLGQLCMLLGIYLCWELLLGRLKPTNKATRVRIFIYIAILAVIAWLLYVADSATSLALMLFTACLMILARLDAMVRRPKRILGIGIAVAVVLGLLEWLVGIKAQLIHLLGRQSDLTSRTPIWEMLIDMAPNPWIGAGYEMFWSGERLTTIWARMGVDSGGIIQAHNGYIETYLNLGIIGLVLLGMGIVSGLLGAGKQLQLRTEYAHAILKISFILAAVAYNYTEAAYKPLNNVFVLLLFSIIQVAASPRFTKRVTERTAKASSMRPAAIPQPG